MKLIKLWLDGTHHTSAGKQPFVSAVIVAGGSSSRMGGIDKMKVELCGKSCLSRSVAAFQNSAFINEIVLVAREELRQDAYLACEGCNKVSRVVKGGADRTHSAYFGVLACSSEADYILIHDGARPLVTEAVIRRVVEGVMRYNAVIPVVPVTDTIKINDDGFVGSTPDRSTLYAVQTPQGFRHELITTALHKTIEQGLSLTDDAAAVERLGMRVRMVDGDMDNRKLTTQVDIIIAEAILRQREE